MLNEDKLLQLKEHAENPIYGIVLPGICTRHGNTTVLSESSLDSYQIYSANMQRLTSHIEENNIPNFYLVERNLLNRINSGEVVPKKPIIPLDNTEFLLVYDNNTFPMGGYHATALQGLYKREGNKFIEISDIDDKWEEIRTQGISPPLDHAEETVGWMKDTGINFALECLTIKNLAREVEDRGYDEIRLAGEKLWYIGGADIDGPADKRPANILDLMRLLSSTDYCAAHRDKGWLPSKIIRGCTFPLTPGDVNQTNHDVKPRTKEWEDEATAQFRRGITLKEILSK